MINPEPSVIISEGAIPIAEPNNPPDKRVSSVRSSVGVNTLSSSKGINSTLTPLPGADENVNVVVDPSPRNTSAVCLTPS